MLATKKALRIISDITPSLGENSKTKFFLVVSIPTMDGKFFENKCFNAVIKLYQNNLDLLIV